MCCPSRPLWLSCSGSLRSWLGPHGSTATNRLSEPALNAGLLGLLTLLIVPVQILLVAFAMRGFNQGWNVELERRDPGARGEIYRDAPPHPA